MPLTAAIHGEKAVHSINAVSVSKGPKRDLEGAAASFHVKGVQSISAF